MLLSDVSLLFLGNIGDVCELTNSHDDHKPRQESPQLDNAAASTVHKVIAIAGFAAQPVGDRGEDVGRDNEEGEVVLEEGAGEDNEKEADGEDLVGVSEVGRERRVVGHVRRRGL